MSTDKKNHDSAIRDVTVYKHPLIVSQICNEWNKRIFSVTTNALRVGTLTLGTLILGTFGNDKGKENVKKPIGLLSKTTTLHVHHAFSYISLLSLHDYDVKMPNFTFNGVRKQATTFLSLSKLECGLQEINSREIRLHLTFSGNWNKLDRVSKKSEFILKVAFSLPSPWSMLKLPVKRWRQREYCNTI